MNDVSQKNYKICIETKPLFYYIYKRVENKLELLKPLKIHGQIHARVRGGTPGGGGGALVQEYARVL